MYKSMKTLITRHFYKNGEAAQKKLDVFYAVNRISDEEYTELTALAETVYGGIWYFLQTAFRHFKDTDFIGGAKSVLCCPEQTVRGVLITFKIEHAVHHVFQHLRAGNVAVFIDVAHHEYGNSLGFAQVHHRHGTVLYLGYAARGGFILLVIKGLDGIDHQNIRL